MDLNFKVSLNSLFLFSYLLILGISPTFSQQPAGMTGSAIWIKGKNAEAAHPQISKFQQQKELFNFNPIFENSGVRLSYKNLLANKYSLFVVFRSDLEQETSIISINTNGEKKEITNKKAGDKNAKSYKNANAKNGMLLSYLVSSDRKVKNKNNLFSILNLSPPNSPKGQRNELMELLYYPRLLNKTEQKQRETYLSIKYGISLLGESDYISSDSKKVWEYKENKSFNHRVTGIARDDYFDLYQKQSGNSSKDGLFIGLKNIASSNQTGTNKMPDKTYFLWGDNNGSTILKTNENGQGDFKSMKRIWKMQSTFPDNFSDISTQIIVDKKDFRLGFSRAPFATMGPEEFIWLVISENGTSGFDYADAKYYKAKEENGRYIFDNVVWDEDKSGSDLFTFIQAPDFFVAYSASTPNCNFTDKGTVDVKIIGGVPPFKIDVISAAYNNSITANERTSQISDMPVGQFQITVQDNFKNKSIQQFKFDSFKEFGITLDPDWSLNAEGRVKLIPKLSDNIEEGLIFKWQYKGTIVSNEKEPEIDQAGEYRLTVMNKQGCEKNLTCYVKESNQEMMSAWSIYPNPTKKGQSFTINFNLEKLSQVNVAIYDISKRLLISEDLAMIKIFEHTDTISTSGMYMIIVTIDGKTESAKLIVK